MRTPAARRPATTNTSIEPRGYLHISGAYATRRRFEIEKLLQGEERRAQRTSPDARILGCDDEGGGLLVPTSTEHLAHRLGRALHEEFGGELHQGFFHDNKLALVWWRR